MKNKIAVALVLFSLSGIAALAEGLPAKGKVSFYSSRFNGRRTASRQVFNNNKLTAAHRTLPFGTKVKLTNPGTQRSVVVTVNDRGPFVDGREISVTRRAARELGITREGTGELNLEVVK